jgi:hypothetical protein
MKLVTGHLKLVTGHEKLVMGFMKLVTGHDKKMNFSKTSHQTSQLVTKPAGHDQTGHKSHKTLFKYLIEIFKKRKGQMLDLYILNTRV